MSLGRGQKHKIILCIACSIFLSTGVIAFGQTMPIAQTVAGNDSTFVPIHSGEKVTIRGVITTIRRRHFSSGTYYYTYVQDESGAVIVHGEGEVPNISEQDMVEVSGILGQRHGMAEISSPEFVKLGTAAVIPLKVKIGQINSTADIARLVEVTGRLKSVSNDPTTPEQHYVQIEDETGTTYVSLVGNIWVESDGSQLEPGAMVKVIGTKDRYRDTEQSTPVLYIEVRHRGELTILKRAPLLSLKQLLLLLVSLLLVSAAPLVWSQSLRRKVKSKTAELEDQILVRNRSQQDLLVSEERYRRLFEQSLAGVYQAAEDGRILDCNQAAARMFGYDSIAEALNLNIDDFYIDRQQRERTIAELAKSGGLTNFEMCLKKKDGSPLWVIENVSSCKSSDGATTVYQGTVIDISESKRADQLIRESEDLYRDLVESSLHLLCTHDLEGNILSMNKGVADVLGYDRNELLKKNIRDILAPEFEEHFDEYLRIVKTEGIATGLMVVETSQGEKRVWEYLNTLRTEGVSTPIIRGIGHDITELRRAQKALKDSETELRALFGAMTDVVLVLDKDGRYIKIAPTNPKLLSRPREELLGRTLHELFPAGFADVCLENIDRVLKTGKSFNIEYQLVLHGSKVWFEGQLSPLSSDCVFLISRDVTWRKQAEEQLKRSEEELRQSQRLEPIGRLAGGVAHDFNNLLTAILGYSEMLLDATPVDDPKHASLSEIKRAGQRAADLTRQLLAFSRKQLLSPKVINLNNIVLSMHKMLRRLIGEDVELVSLLDPRLGQVKADPSQIEQVIVNLAVNARDAMPSGGKITIETSNVEVNEKNSNTHLGIAEGVYVTVRVIDSGCGMDDQVMSHIFEPFFTTKDLGKGTGLGLATVYGIIQQSGGHILVESAPGKGTTFKIYLPEVGASAESESPGATALQPAKTGETILVVEDEDIVLKLVRNTLTQAGYEVLTATNGAEAIELFSANRDRIDLVLTDIVMPQMGGRKLVEKLLQTGAKARILFMSGYTDDLIVRDEFLGEGVPLLQKPFSPADLLEKIREILPARVQ